MQEKTKIFTIPFKGKAKIQIAKTFAEALAFASDLYDVNITYNVDDPKHFVITITGKTKHPEDIPILEAKVKKLSSECTDLKIKLKTRFDEQETLSKIRDLLGYDVDY